MFIKGDCENFIVLRHKKSVRKLRPNRGEPITSQPWYEVGKGEILHPIHLNNNTEWESIPPSPPNFYPGYGQWFDSMCNAYVWYLDAVIYPDFMLGPTIQNDGDSPSTFGHVASVESDLYLPKGCYVGIEGNFLLFNSGRTMNMNPYLYDFVGVIKYVKGKEIQGFSSITKIVGIGMVEWDFQDDYGVKCSIRIKANYIPNAKLILFSPQAYFLEHQAGSVYFDHTGTVLTFDEGCTLGFNYTRGSIFPFSRGTTTVRSRKGFFRELIRVLANLTTG